MNPISISRVTFRRFVLGRQGLWPGRRFAGEDGTTAALHSAEALQLDPLNVIARSQDIAMHARVLDYQPEYLQRAAYQRREFFDYGGGLFLYPMRELPFWQPAMQSFREPHTRWGRYYIENPELVNQVLTALRERGPLGNRDFQGNQRVNSYRGRKDTALALFALWLGGEIMIHHRKGFDRYYDLAERVVPAQYAYPSTREQAQEYFSSKAVAFMGLLREKRWAYELSGYLHSQLSWPEARTCLATLRDQNIITPLQVEGSKDNWIVLSADLPLLETLERGATPVQWQPLGPDTSQEVTLLAPLEIVSARGRARQVFDFDYIWEVYKPLEQRRWGYYTLPILYGDNLVARIDSRLERKSMTLQVKGFWLEQEASADDADFANALAKGLVRFARFLQAGSIDLDVIQPAHLHAHIQALVSTALS